MEESRYWQQWPGTGGDADEQNDDELQGWALQDGAIDGLVHRLEDIHCGRTLSAAAAAGDKNEAFIVAVFEADLDSVRQLLAEAAAGTEGSATPLGLNAFCIPDNDWDTCKKKGITHTPLSFVRKCLGVFNGLEAALQDSGAELDAWLGHPGRRCENWVHVSSGSPQVLASALMPAEADAFAGPDVPHRMTPLVWGLNGNVPEVVPLLVEPAVTAFKRLVAAAQADGADGADDGTALVDLLAKPLVHAARLGNLAVVRALVLEAGPLDEVRQACLTVIRHLTDPSTILPHFYTCPANEEMMGQLFRLEVDLDDPSPYPQGKVIVRSDSHDAVLAFLRSVADKPIKGASSHVAGGPSSGTAPPLPPPAE